MGNKTDKTDDITYSTDALFLQSFVWFCLFIFDFKKNYDIRVGLGKI